MSVSSTGAKANESDSLVSVIRILLIGDQPLFLAGLRSLIQSEPGLTLVGQTLEGRGVSEVVSAKSDIILFAPASRSDDSLNSLPDLTLSSTPVLLVTGSADAGLALRAVNLGAMGVLNASAPPSHFFMAIRKVHNGEAWINRSLMGEIVRAKGRRPDPESIKIAALTKREREVIALLCEGLRNKQIAERLFVAECTVRHNLTAVFDKLGLQDRMDLLIYAHQHGLARISLSPRSVDSATVNGTLAIAGKLALRSA